MIFVRVFLCILIALVGGFVLWGGVQEFNAAGAWISVVRGAFWIIVGAYAMAFGLKILWRMLDE